MKLEFAYDYRGRRIFKKVYSGEILEKHLSFVYDGYKLIEERNALDNNVAVRKYVWQPESLDRDVPLTVYDVASDKIYYFHTDANKNVTELSDESGNVVAHYEYSPFGSLTKVTGDYAGNNPFRFSSEYFDKETGLVYYNYRYYNPEFGRWISRDPIEEQGGYNLYCMLNNEMLYGWDVLGLTVILGVPHVCAPPRIIIPLPVPKTIPIAIPKVSVPTTIPGPVPITPTITPLSDLPTPKASAPDTQPKPKTKAKDRRKEQQRKSREEKHGDPDYQEKAPEGYAKYKAKELEKTKGKDARRKAHDAKGKGEGDRTKSRIDEDYE